MSAPSVGRSALPLLNAVLQHEYFFPAAFTGFTATPLPQTATVCRRLGLRLLQEASGLTLFVLRERSAQGDAGGLQNALAGVTLCWRIAPTDGQFAAFTALDFSGADHCFVFTPRVGKARDGSLTGSATTLPDDSDVWPRQPLRFDFRPEGKMLAGIPANLVTAAGVKLNEIAVANPDLVVIDARAFGSGAYRLMQRGSELTRWFADERGVRDATAVAMLVLPGAVLAKALAEAMRRGPADAAPVYAVKFPAREVRWRYHIFNAELNEELRIEPCDDDLPPDDRPPAKPNPFVGVKLSALPAAKSFEAVEPLKLKHRPPNRFALHRGSTGRFKPLPVAGLLLGRPVHGAEPCADIFVHL